MKDWCCKSFQRMIDLYPEKGFSIIAFKDVSCDYKSFYFVAVPFDREVRHALKDEISLPLIKDKDGNKIPIGIAIELRFPISFCPHCGQKLSPLIIKNRKKFDLLAENHALAEKTLSM
jgi:prepilin signal peptidase PulO-like enzyme (type II secretory pathway)